MYSSYNKGYAILYLTWCVRAHYVIRVHEVLGNARGPGDSTVPYYVHVSVQEYV